jgi:uncharacterized protein YkwD
MRKLTILGVLLAVGGCDGGGGEDEIIFDPWYVQYGNGHPIAAESPDFFTLQQESDAVDLINMHRVAAGLNALIEDNRVADLARAHSIHMAIHGFASRFNPEGDGPADRASRAGLFFWAYDENIVAGAVSASDAVNSWLAVSTTHDRIDDPSWDAIGVGYNEDPNSAFFSYWTVDFLE